MHNRDLDVFGITSSGQELDAHNRFFDRAEVNREFARRLGKSLVAGETRS
jgi:hypothetical protein